MGEVNIIQVLLVFMTFVVIKLKIAISFANVKEGLHRPKFILKAFQDIFFFQNSVALDRRSWKERPRLE